MTKNEKNTQQQKGKQLTSKREDPKLTIDRYTYIYRSTRNQ
jgi:hypothetical protein